MFAPNRLAESNRLVAVASCGRSSPGAIGYAVVRVIMILTGLSASDFRQIGVGLFATWLRVNLTLVLGALWTISSWRRHRIQPAPGAHRSTLAQIALPFPPPVFPVVMLVLIRMGGGLGFGSIVLLLLGTQWYILFNVIAGPWQSQPI